MINKNFLLVLTCLLGILLQTINIRAQNTNNNDPTFGLGNQDSNSKLTPHDIVAGIILILTGLTFCFAGRRIYRLTLFIIGFYVGVIIGMVVLANAQPANGYTSSPDSSRTIIVVVSLAFGLLVGSIFMCCASVAIWFLGALAGFTLALFILAWKSNGLIQSNTGRTIFIIAFTAVGFLLACFFKNAIIILGTSFIGSYATILGIDLFAKTGFSQSVKQFMNGTHQIPSYDTNTKIYIMLAAMVVLFIIGSLVQFRYHNHYQFGPVEHSNVRPDGEKYNRWQSWRNRSAA